MKFNENLVELRKKENMTQDELAEKLNVSRQTIYKWETGATYPDMDKVMDIAKLFHVSIDDLVNESVTEDTVSKDEILSAVKKYAKGVGFSVMLMIIGISVLITMSAFNDETLEIIGLILMFVCIGAGVMGCVYFCFRFSNFKKFHKDISFVATKAEQEANHSRYMKCIIIGIFLIFLGLVTLFGTCFIKEDMFSCFGTAVLFLLVAIAVNLFINGGILHSLYQKESELLLSEEEQQKRRNPWDMGYGIIMMVATIVYLIWSFVRGDWAISWIVFAVGGLLCGIYAIILSSIKKTK